MHRRNMTVTNVILVISVVLGVLLLWSVTTITPSSRVVSHHCGPNTRGSKTGQFGNPPYARVAYKVNGRQSLDSLAIKFRTSPQEIVQDTKDCKTHQSEVLEHFLTVGSYTLLLPKGTIWWVPQS